MTDMKKALEIAETYIRFPALHGAQDIALAAALLCSHAEEEALRGALESIQWKYINETQVKPEDNYAKGRLAGLAACADIAGTALTQKGDGK